VIYVKNFAGLNAGYGAFGGIMALLLWIYYSGYIFIWAHSRFVAILFEKDVDGAFFL
jgi:uncharacterized BrkB/YihY/UPF0761 family membrane protein